MSLLLNRVRASGRCPPSLLVEDLSDGGFGGLVLKAMGAGSGFGLRSDIEVVADFTAVMERVKSIANIPGDLPVEYKQKTLEYRRSVVLALIGATPTDSPVLGRILAKGYLTEVKPWLDDALRRPDGGVDFLLHLLANIFHLPVTKAIVKSSGMGKAVGAVEKHPLCKGTPNETAIKARVQAIKSAWQASVKERKPKEAAPIPRNPAVSAKREAVSAAGSPAKRAKTEPETKKSSFSSLLKKVSTSAPESAAEAAVKDKIAKQIKASPAVPIKKATAPAAGETKPKAKSSKRVKWADHFGGQISKAQVFDGGEVEDGAADHPSSVSWTDRKKRDRLREKELLAKAKRSKLMDDDDDDDYDLPKAMQPSTAWRVPSLLPDSPDGPKAKPESPELQAQLERVKTVVQARYASEYEVPRSPAPLSDIEQALDMTSQASAAVADIPFFVPQEEPAAASAPYVAPPPTVTPPAPQSPATPEFVQALGLPMFLVGHPVQALQTLASSPSLLSTLVDANGVYDQARLLSLVQTISSTGGQTRAPTLYQPPAYGAGAPATSYGQPSPQPPVRQNGFGKSDDGNLHVSGYGPSTTESDLIAAFSPYVRVDEVVLKGTFAFVNTSDPASATRAREALAGTLICGMPVRINQATRKSREAEFGGGGGGAMQRGSFTGATSVGFGAAGNVLPPVHGQAPPIGGPPAPPPPMQVNADAVRDDRGNPSTKNLFVAGYGPGTSEQQLRDMFSQYAQVTGVVSKGTFAFVNTSDKAAAVRARQSLNGTTYNGGTLRINFAKETGRLGTSFDLTYGPNTGPNARRGGAGPPQQPNNMSYYGRGGF